MVKQEKQKKASQSSTFHLLHTSVWNIYPSNSIPSIAFHEDVFHKRIGPDFGLPGGEEGEKEEACKLSLVELKNQPSQMIQRILLHHCAVLRNFSCR